MTGFGLNYYNYYTEIEDHFRKTRGTGMFYISSLDWALIDAWKCSGVPLEAVLRGIDAAFERWRGRKHKNKTRLVNSLAFCAQEVLTEAQRMAGNLPARREAAPPFPVEDLRQFLTQNAATLRRASAYAEIASVLERLASEAERHFADLEDLERRLTVLEEKAIAIAHASQDDDQLLASRRELDAQLRPYRGKMTAEQIAMLEKQYFERTLLESAGLPRLSLFYLK